MSDVDRSYTEVNAAQNSPTEAVRILAISPFAQDHLRLQSIISHSKWVLRSAGTYAEALKILFEDAMPIVITERDLPPYSWKDVLTELASMKNPPRPDCGVRQCRRPAMGGDIQFRRLLIIRLLQQTPTSRG
jgi:hypothetical protein